LQIAQESMNVMNAPTEAQNSPIVEPSEAGLRAGVGDKPTAADAAAHDYADIASQLVGAPATPAAPADLDYSSVARDVVKHENAGPTPADVAADEERKMQMLKWRVMNENRAPEEQAEILKLSSALGWTPDVVAADLQKARSAVEAQGLDSENVLRAHPALAEFIGDPRTSALARSDTARLTGLAYLVGSGISSKDAETIQEFDPTGLGVPPQRFDEGTPGAVSLWLKQRSLARDTHDLQTQLMLGTAPDGESAPEEFDPTGTGVATQPRRPLTDAEKARLAEQIRKNDAQLRKLSQFGDGVEELGWGKRQLAKTARLLIDMGPELAKGAAVAGAAGLATGGFGSSAAGTAYWSYETAPGIFWQLHELKDAGGNPLLSDSEAQNYAVAASIPIGLLNAVGIEGLGVSATKWATSKPFVEKALSLVARDGVERLLAAKGTAAVLSRAALNYGTHAVQGGLMVAGQSAITQAALEVAAGQHGVDAPGGVGDAFAKGFWQGMRDFAIIAAWGPARRALAEHGALRASAESAQVLKDIADNTRESKLAQRSPEEFGKLVDRFGPEKKVYVTRAEFDNFAQEQKVAPRGLAAGIVEDGGNAYDAAVQSGGDIAIPIGKWAKNVVSQGHDKKLFEDSRMSLDELTPRQMKDAMKAIAKSLQERSDARGPSFENEVAQLRKTLYGAARQSGHGHAQSDAWSDQFSRYTASMSLRMDVPLRDAIVRVGLPQLRLEGREVLTGKLREALKVTPEEARAVALPQADDAFAGLSDASLADVRAVQAAAKTPSEKAAAERLARAAYTDALIPELGNARAHTEFMQSEQAKAGVHVMTDMPGLKARNDKYGQLEGDKALQTYGRAFSAESRAQRGKAHRMSTGDEFYAWFPDADKASAFVAGLKARLAGQEGLLREGDQLSTYAGVGPSKEAAAAELVKAKTAAKAKYGDSRNGGAVGHGESFVSASRPAEDRAIIGGIREADITGQWGGLVPIREAREASGLPPDEFDKRLIEMWNAGRVSLKRADDPRVKRGGIKAQDGGEFAYVISPKAGPAPEHVTLRPQKSSLEQERRGTIRFSVDKAGRAFDFDIRALRGDKSTLAHESAHWLSWSLHEIATRSDAPEDVKADYGTLLSLGGWKTPEERLADNAERSKLAGMKKLDEAQQLKLRELTAKEEHISHAWEQYLGEGKAPEPGLQRTFFRFRRWMEETYGGLGGIAEQFKRTYGEDLWLSDDVRGVFNRLLAVDNEVEHQRADDSRLDVAGVLRLTPEEAVRLQEIRSQKYDAARAGLDKAVSDYNGEAAKGFLRAERERLRSDVTDEIAASSPYTLVDFLLTGQFRGEEGRVFEVSQLPEALKGEDGKPARLSYTEAVKVVGPETAKLLKRRGFVHDKKGGLHADELAPLFGFKDGKEMLETLAGVPDMDAAIELATAQRFEEVFGPKLDEQADALRAAGKDAMHNPADVQEALFVRGILAREVGAKVRGALSREVLDMNAQRIVRGTRVRELSPKYYLDSERRTAKEAFDLMGEAKRARDGGKLDEAQKLYGDALHKWDSVILAKLLWRHAKTVLDELGAAEARMKRAAKDSTAQRLGKADPSLVYADANETILSSVGFKDTKPDASKIDAVLAAMKRDGAQGIVDGENGKLESALWDSQHLRDIAGNPVSWEDSTVDEAMNVADAVENVRKVAGNRNKVNIADRKLARDSVIEATDESSKKLGPTNEPSNPDVVKAGLGKKQVSQAKNVLRAGSSLLQSIDANLTEVRQHIERLVGGDRAHPLYGLLVTEREKARDFERRLSEQFVDAITKHWLEMPKELRKRVNEEVEGLREMLPMPDTGGILNPKSPMSRGELWLAVLNFGNAEGRQRLRDGHGWSEGQLRAAFEKFLSKDELQWIQGVWKTLDGLWPHVERVQMESEGVRPTRVEPLPFKVGDVEMPGGYFPLRADPRVASKEPLGEKQIAETVGDLMRPLFATPATAKGHTKERAENASYLLDLRFDVIPAHVQQVVHDVSHRAWVRSAASVVWDPRFRQLVAGRLGLPYEKQFRSWVQAVASQTARTANDTLAPVQGILSWAKSRATLASVGFNVAVPLQDLTNPLLPVLGGDLSVLALSRVTRQLATDWSAQRAFALENSIELRARAKHGNSLGLDIPGLIRSKGALGEVEKAAYWMMETSDRLTATPVWLAKYYERSKAGAPHEDAVRDAEALVQKYFPASDMASRAAILRDRGLLGSLTFLYGFGSKLYNINRVTVMHAYDAWKEPGAGAADKAKAIGVALAVMTTQALALGAMGDFLAGHGPKSGEDAKDWAKERALSLTAYQFPIANLLFGGRAALPSSGLYAKLKNELVGAAGGDIGPAETIAAIGSALTLGTGANQFLRTGKYLDDSFRHDFRRGHYGRVASGLIYGDRDIITPLNLFDR
jgi:GGDEF domain-containing protein